MIHINVVRQEIADFYDKTGKTSANLPVLPPGTSVVISMQAGVMPGKREGI
jgi:hypothetical protein